VKIDFIKVPTNYNGPKKKKGNELCRVFLNS